MIGMVIMRGKVKFFFYLLFKTMFKHQSGLVAKNGENDQAGIYGRQPVADGHKDCIFLAIVALVIITGKCNKAAKGQTKRIKDLSGGIQPN